MIKDKKLSFFMLGLVLSGYFILSSAAYGADKKPVEVTLKDKCPVCGMFVAKYKTWIAQIVFNDGTYAAFDGPKDMFKFYADPAKFLPKKKKSDISGVFVTEYYSAKLMGAESLFFVAGSDVYGPMGGELIPLATMDQAKEFMKDHKGKKILRFSEITPGELN